MSSCRKNLKKACSPSNCHHITLEAMVSEFIAICLPCEREELAFFKGLSLEKAVEFAALAKNKEGKRFSHQRRLAKASLKEGSELIMKMVSEIQQARSFEEVLEKIRRVAFQVKGLGELYSYDTSLRISVKLGYEPKQVYLHAGTKIGAKRLGVITDKNRDSVPMTELPEALRQLNNAHEVESFLCI